LDGEKSDENCALWFLYNRDIKLVIEASEIKGKYDLLDIEAISAFGQPQN
jgi:hypothetical protein